MDAGGDPRCAPRGGTRRGHGAGQHWQSRRCQPGAGWCRDTAGSQLGPWQLQGPRVGRLSRGSAGCHSPSVGPGHAVPPRCGTGVIPAGSCRRWGPCCPSARPIHAGPERWIRLRHLPASGGGGEAGAAARWSRLCTAIFLGGEGWGEMDALTCGGATAGNVTEGRRAAGAGAEPVPVPIPVPVLVT